MTPEQLFSVVNLVALVGWILLVVLPRRAWVSSLVTAVIIPGLLAVVYVALLVTQWSASGGFTSLAQVSLLFSHPWVLLAGWTHYLTFDLLIGSWESRDARARQIPHLLVLPCLFLTFMFGPVGWLLYMAVRAARSRAVAVA